MKKAKKTIIITGGNTGLGFETAKVIAGASNDWHVVIASRSQHRGNEAVNELIQSTRNPNVSSMELDLASISSIKRFSEKLMKAGLPPLHAIICNAGAQFAQGTQTTADGVEATFGVNHLGHFLLVRLLLNQLQEQGRIVVVSSDTHDPAKKTGMPAPSYTSPAIMADPVASDKFLGNIPDLAKGQIRYTTSKLCNLYFTYELSRRIRKSKPSISVVALNPGMMPGKGSALTRDYKPFLRFMWNNVMPLMRFVRSSVRTTKQSGADLANLVFNESVITGSYWDGSKKISSSDESYNQDRAVELWNWSSESLDLSKEI
ncbi:SDR family NAD(P)-dependent oxidoreductase [Cytobacillus purgationiresistens]|uniref:NAD(P)-dependent dehydrogenase (Short-subunit alcohol dehydrogenase family) n=1 Tax=Cytobacillus purgationiresistens TaxID=863449 RepID=A0ABU0AIT0_9BACI|nr:SDR family NAD(P)-dependent oxidoreductase [Cytobacillus purgationiresistens]MDQ0271165.1 NAD(P)-dependent dehydrogenase (short-subunit alcohol dehydrogenase family) [Cytobacillus purgationiresistens]